MTDIIPAIIAENFEDLEKNLRQVEAHANWVQLDIMDGKFVPNKTFNDPVKLKELKTQINLEAHLMIEDPWLFIDAWLDSGIKRVIVHYEAVPTRSIMESMLKKAKSRGIEFAVAFNPETDWQLADDLIPQIDMALFLSVHPGFYGKEFIPSVLTKILTLRKNFPDVRIEVDGGINLKNAKQAANAGVDGLAVGSFIFDSDDPAQAVQQLKEEIETVIIK
ncbi:MAG: ribulose-phosphate 3-epimerase [bacterium]|nr:ribulose-phosphate 3-epimerase [bacterium]